MSYPTQNIYNDLHSKLVNLIIDDDTHVLTAYFRLNPQDILNLKLSQTIYLDGQVYLINEVRDYEPNQNGLTKAILIKRND